jgi:hypothetical protein
VKRPLLGRSEMDWAMAINNRPQIWFNFR